MKIVHIITRMIEGGADENTLITCNRLVASGHDVWLMCGPEYSTVMTDRLDPRARLVVVQHLRREIDALNDLAGFLELVRALRTIGPDIIHTHTSKAGVLGRVAGFLSGRPLIVHTVHIAPFVNVTAVAKTGIIAVEKAAAVLTDGFIHVSDGMRRLYADYKIGDSRPHVVIESGMDLNAFIHATPAPDLVELTRPQGVVVCYLANFEERKQHSQFVTAIAEFIRGTPHKILFAGRGHLEDSLNRLVSELRLENNVHLIGFRSDPERVVAASDIGVYPSLREGLPRAVVQYALGGKPVVASALPGIEQVVRHGNSGFLFPPGDTEECVRYVIRLIEDERLRASMSAALKNLDLSRWAATSMSDRIDAFYRTLGR